VLAYHVVRRRHEFGVRMAVGAAPATVMRMVLAHTVVLLAAGLMVGLAVSLAARRVIAALLYGVSATDPTTIVVAAAILSAIALLASYLPARRAAGIEPTTALRED
jgi:ABC-type antimicrobial peptide transport system permease subunit